MQTDDLTSRFNEGLTRQSDTWEVNKSLTGWAFAHQVN